MFWSLQVTVVLVACPPMAVVSIFAALVKEGEGVLPVCVAVKHGNKNLASCATHASALPDVESVPGKALAVR